MDKWLPIEASKRTYWKEILRAGKFAKTIDGKPVGFEVTKDLLSTIVAETQRFFSNGNKTSIFKQHVEDEDNKYGNVLALETRDGGSSLYAQVGFDDEQAERTALKNDVSVFLPPKYIDGLGQEYKYLLKHLAITSNPGIPGLGPYLALAASNDFILSLSQDESTMDLSAILDALGLTAVEGDDEATMTMIVDSIELMKTELEELKKDKPADDKPADDKPADEPIEASLPPLVMNSIIGARTQAINSLVTSGAIAPAQADRLRKQYANKQSVGLALSNNDDGSGFEFLLQQLATASKYGAETKKIDGVAFSNDAINSNVLVADAEARAKSN